jgi:hypothetical protein
LSKECFNDRNPRIFIICVKLDEENCLISKDFTNEMQQMFVENALRCNKQCVPILGNCRDWMVINVRQLIIYGISNVILNYLVFCLSNFS